MRASTFGDLAMADQKGLRTIGFGLTAVTLAVTFVAMLLVTDAMHATNDIPSFVASATR